MMQERPSQLWVSATQCFLGCIGLAVLTFVCIQLKADVATAGFAYLILLVLLSLKGSFIGSLALSITAAACLAYFFAPPALSFMVEVPQAEKAQSSHNALVNTIPALVWSARPDGSRDFHSQRWLEFTGLSPAEAAGAGWAAG